MPSETGGTVALGAVADIEIARTPGGLRRVDRRTTSWVMAEFDKEEVLVAEGKKLVEQALVGLVLPDGYSWDWGHQMRRENEGLFVLLFGVIMSLSVVLLLMAALFESISQPLAILITCRSPSSARSGRCGSSDSSSTCSPASA